MPEAFETSDEVLREASRVELAGAFGPEVLVGLVSRRHVMDGGQNRVSDGYRRSLAAATRRPAAGVSESPVLDRARRDRQLRGRGSGRQRIEGHPREQPRRAGGSAL